MSDDTPDDPLHPALHERGRPETRSKLLTAADAVFKRSGFASARISDITRSAGLSHGSFYTYYGSKEEVFVAVVERVVDDLLRRSLVHRLPGENPVATIARANAAYLDAYYDHEEILLVHEEVASINPNVNRRLEELRAVFVARTERAIERFQANGLASSDLDAHYAAHALTGMVRQFTLTTSGGLFAEVDRGKAALTLTLLWAAGLGMPSQLIDEFKAGLGLERMGAVPRRVVEVGL